MTYLSDCIISKLFRLKIEADLILLQWEERNAPIDAVNVSDLSCVDAGIQFDGERISWTVTVAEAAPDAHAFQLWMIDELHKVGYHRVTVHTEW